MASCGVTLRNVSENSSECDSDVGIQSNPCVPKLTTLANSSLSFLNHSRESSNQAYRVWMLNKREFQYYYPAVIYLAILLVLGLTGNSCVLYIYGTRFKKTTANFFIRVLAVLDMICCIFAMTFEIADLCFSLINYEAILCKIFRTIEQTAESASAIALVCIGYDRYLHICKPMKIFTHGQAKKMIYIALGVCSLSAIPSLFVYGTSTSIVDGARVSDCYIDGAMKGTTFATIFYVGLATIFLTCLLLLVITYGRIGYAVHIWRKTQVGESCGKQSGAVLKHDLSVNKKNAAMMRTMLMLVMVAFLFDLSYIPCTVMKMINDFGALDFKSFSFRRRQIAELSLRSHFLSNALNPLVYVAFDRKFRAECYSLIKGHGKEVTK